MQGKISSRDCVVIGAGPAGLSAAVRLRFVKRFNKIPMDVVVIDPGDPGGLLRMGERVIIGPSFIYRKGELLELLLKDFHYYNIPHIREKAISIKKEGKGFAVLTENGKRIKTHSIIIAAGMGVIHNEPDYYSRGVYITSGGYEFFKEIIDGMVKESKPPYTIVGSVKTENILPLLEPLMDKLFILTPETIKDSPLKTEQGEIVKILGDGWVQGIKYRKPDGSLHFKKTGAVFLDYNGFAISRPRPFNGLENIFEQNGYINSIECRLKGVFAAGDILGHPASVTIAMADGINAGLFCYSYLFRLKFKKDPVLYAYLPHDIIIDHNFKDLPKIKEDSIPVALLNPKKDRERFLVLCNGKRDLKEISSVLSLKLDEIKSKAIKYTQTGFLSWIRL